MANGRPDDNWTLGDTRDWLRPKVLDGGETCPCCDQWAQVYRWSLYTTAVMLLTKFYRTVARLTFVHSKAMAHKGQGDAARLRLWGLVEGEKERRPDGGKSGWWRVTDKGEAFLRGQQAIPKYVFVYKARALRFEGPAVTVWDSLGRTFDFDAMMRGDWE